MSCFDEGFIPKGWERGDPLRIEPVPTNGDSPQSWVCTLIWKEFDFTSFDSDAPAKMDDIACLRVTLSEARQAAKWLKWWRSKDA